MIWTTNAVTTLIEEYQRYPCLYAIKNKAYHNRNARNHALQQIANALSSIRPGTSIEEIKTKISGLRTTYLIEKRKFEKTVKSGAGVDFIYEPSLWYFKKMMFLNEHITSRPSTSNLHDNYSESLLSPVMGKKPPICSEFEDNYYDESQIQFISDVDVLAEGESINLDTQSDTNVSTKSCEDESMIIGPAQNLVNDDNGNEHNYSRGTKTPGRKRKKVGSDDQENQMIKDASSALHAITNVLQNEKKQETEKNTSEDLYGQLVANRLKSITNFSRRIRAQQEIDSVLYKYLMMDDQ